MSEKENFENSNTWINDLVLSLQPRRHTFTITYKIATPSIIAGQDSPWLHASNPTRGRGGGGAEQKRRKRNAKFCPDGYKIYNKYERISVSDKTAR